MTSRRTTILIAAGVAILAALAASAGMIHRDGINASLKSAVMRGDVPVTKRLLEAGANPNMTIPLHLRMPNSLASARFTWEMFRNSQTHPLALLTVAALRPHNGAAIATLVEHGADPNHVSLGITALTEAIAFGNASDAKVLLDHGARIQPSPGSLAPGAVCIMSMYASYRHPGARGEKDFAGVIQLLLDHGLDVDCTDSMKKTLLMSASESCDVKAATILLKHGANTSLKDANGLTAADYARMSGQKYIVKMLTSNK